MGRINRKQLATTASLAALVSVMMSGSPAHAQANEGVDDRIVVTGSRIQRSELTSPTPVTSVGSDTIDTDRSVTVEDVFRRLPQAGGGANATGATDGLSLGASTIDLRGLGQNRTLVLINGTRATPFSFRNTVDTNTLPTGLIKRVDVLTGGAAAIYGADAVSGVVNFILNDEFEGLQLSATGEVADGGAESVNSEVIVGAEFFDGRGHVVGYVGYTKRFELLAGEREFTSGSATFIPSEGGNFTDVASDNFFAFDDEGQFQTTRQTVDVTPDRYLIQPMERLHASTLYKFELSPDVEFYGRAQFTNVKVTGAGSTGQTPISVNQEVVISETNPYIPAEAMGLLTFVDGEALVNVERNLGLGMQRTKVNRNTYQFKGGLRGALTDNLSWDAYAQYGSTDETARILGNAIVNDASGANRFAALADTVDIFGPDADFSDFGSEIIHSSRKRDQFVASLVVSGSSADLFQLPAGPVDFAAGYEYRRETGRQTPGVALQNGLAFGLGGVSSIDASFDTNEAFGEILVPLLSDLPFVQQLNFEGAYRRFDFSTTGVGDADKFGGTWIVNDQIRFRGQRQTTVRSPNLGEFAGPENQLSLALFDPASPSFVPRFAGRFNGDPCLDGSGDATQCAAFGAPAPGTMFDSSQAIYSFGGNPDIKPEKGKTITAGVILTPDLLPGASLVVDYINIEITDAVSQIQPAAALQNCYIDNPSPDNPLCGAVLRDPVTGLISKALVNDFNLSSLKQEAFDVKLVLPLSSLGDFGHDFSISYANTIVIAQSRQPNATVAAVDCKGTFGGTCSGDFATFLQPDYKHRADFDWENGPFAAQLSWRRIGSVVNADNRADKLSAQNYFDLTAIYNVTEDVRITAGIKNLFDKQPPLPQGGGNFYGTLSEYDPIGRAFGASVTAKF
ncbi:TonB-dependent receptor domain-containing protein [Hyphococcus luteus]|uniref:TonB-dependent receptor n=1 Tax=Hyphococcus luteus TaxID=2058213 RepID=A0A2S7K9Z5_9PROT|nr:TonB-dependent receptor [Marinicaulis flavus]PQA89303.1 TonB-dependent receptor [Marinicaulis flavus]